MFVVLSEADAGVVYSLDEGSGNVNVSASVDLRDDKVKVCIPGSVGVQSSLSFRTILLPSRVWLRLARPVRNLVPKLQDSETSALTQR